jgi:hypothetical protein
MVHIIVYHDGESRCRSTLHASFFPNAGFTPISEKPGPHGARRFEETKKKLPPLMRKTDQQRNLGIEMDMG